MDQNRRLVVFLALTALLWFGWFGFVQPRFFPNVPAQKPAVVAEIDKEVAAAEREAAAAEEAARADAPPPELPNHPARKVTLGSLEGDAGYFSRVTLTSRGAAVESIELNDDRYRELTNRDRPLKIVGAASSKVATFLTGVAAVDEQLAKSETSTAEIDWQAEPVADPDAKGVNQAAVFTLRAPDGTVELVKRYTLRKVDGPANHRARDTNPDGYVLDVAVTLRNLSDEPRALSYTLQGPVGLPVENEEHTSKYRELEIGFLDADGDLNEVAIPAVTATEQARAIEAAEKAAVAARNAERAVARKRDAVEKLDAELQANPGDKTIADRLAKERAVLEEFEQAAANATDAAQAAGRGLENWTTPFRYAGTEVQYFAALILPKDDRPLAQRFKDPLVARGSPQLVAAAKDPNFNDVSFVLTSDKVTVPAGGEVTHEYSLYAGPKRKELLRPLGADAILDLGWFAVIGQGMLWLMEKLHDSVGAPYWLAIICLTVIVRACLFPLSRKQAIGAAKMKDLQPKLTELKTKFGDDHQKLFQAQSELFKKHGYGPLGPMASGCLPIFLQLPIFMGLYAALQNSIDLRMAEFLWIDNLAAPDRLFRMPFSLPFLGADFNILPLVTVVLFYVQQKLFMPPATTPEQEMQYKMMNFMTLFMGFFFYHVPAGLCVYFIASSLWSIAERKLLGRTKAAHIGPAEAAEIDHEIEEMTGGKKPGKPAKTSAGKGKPAPPEPPKEKSFIQKFVEKLFDAADQARRQAELGNDIRTPNNNTPGKPKSKSKSRR